MNRLVQSLVITLGVCFVFGSCGNDPKTTRTEQIRVGTYDPRSGDGIFRSSFIHEIELIPLETTDSSLIGTSPECIVDRDGGYYIADMNGSQKILRYDSTGRFLNTIGSRGHGPQEYLGISNYLIDTLTGHVSVFSNLDKKVCVYDKDGTFVSSRTFSIPFSQGWPVGECYWLYEGYMNGHSEYRVLKIDAQEKIMETLLPADVQIMPMAESFPVFIPVSGGKLLLRETFGNQIYCLEDGNAVPIFEFDFGTYSIPDEYYEMDDVKESGNYIMQRDFVCIDRFMENKKYVFVQALLKKTDDKNGLVYGILDKRSEQWQWYTFADIMNNRHPGAGTVKILTPENELLCLVDPTRLMDMPSEERSVFKNPVVIGNLTEESNPVLIKCQLK